MAGFNLKNSINRFSDRFFKGLGSLVTRLNPPAALPLIDIGNFQCKLVRGSYGDGGNWKLNLFKEVPAPGEMVLNSLLPQYFFDRQGLELTLRFFREEYIRRESYVLVTFPDSAFSIHTLKLSNVLFRESPENAIKKELSLVLPFRLTQYFFDYQVVNSEELYSEVAVVATLIPNIHEIVELFQQEGLYPLRLEPSIFNVINAFQFHFQTEELADQNLTLLHFSHESTSLVIIKNGKVRAFTRLGFGGDVFVRALTQGCHLSPKAALSTLQESLIFHPEYNDEQEKNPFFIALRQPLLKLLEGVFDFFEEYLSRYREEKIHGMFIAGGLANMKNINFLLESNFKIPVFRLSDLAEVTLDSSEAPSTVINSAATILGMMVS